MPIVTGAESRRNFLRTSLAAGAALALNSSASGSPQDAALVRWALLSDTHSPADRANAYRGFRPAESLAKVVPQVLEFDPAGAVIAGDLARLKGLPGDYEVFAELLKPLTSRMPVAMALGNHDDRANFLKAFPSSAGQRAPVKNKHISILDVPPVRLIVLDSLLFVDSTPGLLGKAQRAWLADYLSSSGNVPTLLVVHHTPDDEDGNLLDSDRFLQMIRHFRQVKALFYGHSHRYGYDTFEGIHLVNLPAVAYNFNDVQPIGWVEAMFSKEGADLKLRAVGGGMAEDGKTRSLAWR